MKKNYEILKYVSVIDEEKAKKQQEEIAISALNIANDAGFPTDYQDVYDHLFENPEYIRLFVLEKNSKVLKGFMIACELNGLYQTKLLHLHGVILHPSIQGNGISRLLLNNAISMTNPDILTAKTHNPRAFNSLASLACYGNEYYPNILRETPKEILEIARNNPFISGVDDELIVRDAYPDIKIQQTYRKEDLRLIFDRLNGRDAQAILVGLCPLIFEESENVKKLVRK